MKAGPTMLRVCADESLRWRIAARLVLVLAGTWSGSALAQSAPADRPRPCKAKFGEVVDFRECNPVTLPGVQVEFLDITSPNPNVTLSCWNYKATDSRGNETTFRQCNTGLLGGSTGFTVADKTFTAFLTSQRGADAGRLGTGHLPSAGMCFLPVFRTPNTL